jgi:hypothetical protein
MVQSVDVQLVSWPESKVSLPSIFLDIRFFFTVALLERSLPLAVGTCAMLGVVIGGFDYTGQLMGDPTSKEEKRKRFFKTPPKPLIDVESTNKQL